MVFSSLPPYFDPSNWQQQQQQNIPTLHHGHGSSSLNPNLTNTNPLLPPPPLPPPSQPRPQPPPQMGPMSASGSIRPGSMAERARLANIPMPEAAIKCPRCESTNTKFCYFNNYSLSQPRHFCKTCRRYWTRGGALRSVPVGGGCRRNRRSKSASSAGSSKSSTGSDVRSSSAAATSSASSDMVPPSLSSLRFMSPIHNLTEFGGGEWLTSTYTGMEQWTIPPPLPPPAQFPFLGAGLDAAAGVAGSSLFGLPFEGSTQLPEPVKMEGSSQDMSLIRRFNSGMNQGNGGVQYSWGGSGGGGSG